MYSKSLSIFSYGWDFAVNEKLISIIKEHFDDPNCIRLGDLSFKNYRECIKNNGLIFENGLYLLKFSDSFYIGKATSCTLLERLAKHYDSRKVGGFNGLLKKLCRSKSNESNLDINQEILMNAKLLLIPIDSEKLMIANSINWQEKIIEILEMDLIIVMRKVFSIPELNSKKKDTLSGLYFKDFN
jgi:hypothetical protein